MINKDLAGKYFVFNSIRPFLFLAFIVTALQAIFTGIGNDEAYYWRFAQDLAWGYFDHPPMVALMIATGSKILSGIAGIRLFTVILSLLTLYLIWLLIPSEDRSKNGSALIYFLLYFSMPLLNIYSFVTTPDVPLIFFSVLYIHLFIRFKKDSPLWHILSLGLIMVCLIYSKYHGILVILLTLVSRPGLLLYIRFWLAALIGICLYLPHLYWQYTHDFISFDYHLSYRAVLFSWKNVLVFFLNVLIVLNPILLPFFAFKRWKIKTEVSFGRKTLILLFWGFLLFFGFSAFRGHVEPQWISIILIPYILFFHKLIVMTPGIVPIFRKFAVFSLSLIFLARIAIALPVNLGTEFQKRDKSFYDSIAGLAGEKPVVFVNTYTEASRFSFYTERPSFSYNFVSFRKNQYDLWDYQNALQNKDVLLVMFPDLHRFRSYQMPNGEFIRYGEINNMQLVNNIKVKVLEYDSIVAPKSILKIRFLVANPYDTTIYFNEKGRELSWLIFFFFMDKERSKSGYAIPSDFQSLAPHSSQELELDFKVDIAPGTYTIGMHLLPSGLFPVSVSKRTYPIEVRE